MMWMSDIAANGPMPSSRPASTLTTAWLTRVMSGNRPERAMTCPMASGSVIGATGGSPVLAGAPLVVVGCLDMRGPPFERIGWGWDGGTQRRELSDGTAPALPQRCVQGAGEPAAGSVVGVS